MTTPSASPAPRLRLVFGALMLAMLLAALDQTIVATALPTLVSDLGGLHTLSWVVTAYLLTTTVSGPVYAKLGDLHGRKAVLQVAIVVFLVGSALCGLSQNMPELVAFRALQGLGGGGLLVTSTALLGDILPPRERGRYQGVFGGVFALATVVGPLVGGFFVEHLSWRWIFYVNLPVGLLALTVITVTFRRPSQRRRRPIDWTGAACLAGALASLVLATGAEGGASSRVGGTLGGLAAPAWLAAGLILVGAFVHVERRAAEPLLPLELFRDRVFLVASLVGFVVGLTMFGAVTYLPLYLQVVQGASPSRSGLQLLPLMGGMLVTSVVSGQLITRFGRYKPFPVVGTALAAVGLVLLSTLDGRSSLALATVYMLILGLGLGMVMQVLVLAVQNAVPYQNLGVATSGATLFRLIGGALGVSLFGALFSQLLRGALAHLMPAEAGRLVDLGPTAVAQLTPAAHAAYLRAFASALAPVFQVAACAAGLAFVATFFLPERPLRRTVAGQGMGEAFAVPRSGESLPELERALSALAQRENRWALYQRLAARAGLSRLDPPELWLLARMGERPPLAEGELARALSRPEAELLGPLSRLMGQRLVRRRKGEALSLTGEGRRSYERLVSARREAVAELLAGWSPERHAEIQRLIEALARTLGREPPVAV